MFALTPEEMFWARGIFRAGEMVSGCPRGQMSCTQSTVTSREVLSSHPFFVCFINKIAGNS